MASPPPYERHRRIDHRLRSQPDLGEVDGDRPKILNEAVVGPDCGGGNPTAYMGKGAEGHHLVPQGFRRGRALEADDSVATKRVKTDFGYYTLSASGGFELSDPRATEEAKEQNGELTVTIRTSVVVRDDKSITSCQSSVSIVSLRREDTVSRNVSYAGSWAEPTSAPTGPEDEGYQSDPAQLDIDDD